MKKGPRKVAYRETHPKRRSPASPAFPRNPYSRRLKPLVGSIREANRQVAEVLSLKRKETKTRRSAAAKRAARKRAEDRLIRSQLAGRK
jgi:hypothetical protein